MKRMYPWQTVRGRLLFLAVGLEVLMLTVLIINSIRLLHSAMSSQVQTQAQQFSPVLIAALTAPLAARDYATMQAVVDESRTKGGLDYIVVVDRYGHRLAANGWPAEMPLPELSKELSLLETGEDPRYDVIVPIEFQRQSLGELHFGVNLSQIVHARKVLLLQGVGIAAIEIFLSSLILLFLGFWLTRHMKSLTQASLEVAAGNLSPPRVPEGNDDVGRLGAAFNIMSRVIAERVNELTVAKEIAEASEAQLRGITHSANDAILMMDPQGAITYWNPAAERILGYRSEEALGHNLHNLLVPERYLAVHREVYPEFLRTGRGNAMGKTLEVFARRKGGQEIAVALSLSAVFLYGAWHAVGILRDITVLKQHERELEQAREAAEAASRAKTEFLANMSHEIRTPMNAIIGMSYLALQSDLTSKQREQITYLHNAAESLIGIINQILDFSKIEAGKMTLEQAPFVLKDTLDEIIRLLKPQLDEKSLELQYEGEDGVLAQDAPLLLGDALRLRQVLINLLSNAAKFTQEGFVRLGVTSCTTDNTLRVVFSVQDSGIGMSAEQMSRLFEEFTQADASTTRQYGGTGLGMAIAGKLIALMGGRIDVKSQLGQGSCFTVEIPFEVALVGQAPLRERRQRIENYDALRGIRVLLVEDNPVNRLLAVEILAKKGVVTDIAENGEEAIRKLQSLPPETFRAMLLDLQMPVLDGYETSRIIRSDPKFDALPIIALSAHVMSFEKERCRQLGMNGYINKPFSPEELWTTLVRAMRKDETGRAVSSLQPVRESLQSMTELGINGVNLSAGIKRAGGDGTLYAKIVEEVLDNFASGCEDLLEFAVHKDSKSGQALAHELRGVLGALGAEALENALASIEEIFSNGADPCGQIQALVSPYADLMAALRGYLGTTGKAPEPAGNQPHQESPVKDVTWLEALADHLGKGNFEAIEMWERNKILLGNHFTPAELAQINRALQQFDFACALECLLNRAER